ncbi:unnamed protein product, partial [Brassica oleracea var. botrytis]
MELGGISVRFLQSSKTSGGPILWLFGLGTTQMENYDHIAPPAVVLTRKAQLEKEVINLTGMVKLMSQQLTALCE